jgi:glycosyltransferase involved in cell wall biosynthesis
MPRERVVFCWSNISGYMAACWRALAREPGVDLRVFAYAESSASDFSHDLMAGLAWTPLGVGEREPERVAQKVAALLPAAVVIPGWLDAAYRSLPSNGALRGTRFVMGMDTPWRGDLRQRAAGWVLRHYLGRMDKVVVAGERAWQYARRLGIPLARIARGLYGVDYAGLSTAFHERRAAGWPRRFLFAGRYSEEKGIATLLDAYGRYRGRVPHPWELVCCGMGPLRPALAGAAGVVDRGFVQPAGMRDVMRASGALVMPSRYDPWPLAIVEGCAAGLPIIASDACGSAVECVRDTVNGFTFATGDAEALAERLIETHVDYDHLPAMGEQSLWLARPFAAENWVRTWLRVLHPHAPGGSASAE